MLNTLLFTAIIVAMAVIFLSLGIMIKGKFPNSHVSHNPEMRRRGIHCAQQQDREARMTPKHAVKATRTQSEQSQDTPII